MAEAHQLCICGELSCEGRGTDCPFSPGHASGTIATEPIRALIEAARSLLVGLASSYDHRELELTGGQVYHPDVRRLNATIATVEKANPASQTTEKPVEGESINVIDPDSGETVTLSVFKVAGGGMFAIDTSYLALIPDLVIPSPFDVHVRLDLGLQGALHRQEGKRLPKEGSDE